MHTPLGTKKFQDLTPAFIHTYFYRWPYPNSCTIKFQILNNLYTDVINLVGNVLTVYTANSAYAGRTFDFVIRAY